MYGGSKTIAGFVLLTLIFYCAQIRSQCNTQVSVLSGTAMVGCIEVSVTSWGFIDTTFSCSLAQPYWVGEKNHKDVSGNGSYTFNFFPSISSLSLNFRGITNVSNEGIEEIHLIVNGKHYKIP